LRRLAAGLDNVVFTGWLDETALRTLMSLSTIGLCAYADDAPQSLPNKPFEYMSAGLPQISSLRGDLESLLTRHEIGLQYQAGDAASLQPQVLRLVDSPDLRRAMASRATALFRDEFDATRIYPRFAAHLEQAAEARAGTSTDER
jgi:glycosyltransferase involved in cell wall biosynthesis